MPYLEQLYFAPRLFRPGSLNACLLATALVWTATALSAALADVIPGVQFITLFPAIITTALICGVAAGFYAVVMATLCAWFFILPPPLRFGLEGMRQAYAHFAFLLVASANVLMVGAMRAAVERLRRVNEKLAALNAALTATFEASPDAILIVGHNRRIRHVNCRACEMFGLRRDVLVGALVEDLLPRPLRGLHVAHHASYVVDPRPRRMGAKLDLMALRGDGTEFPVDVQIGPIVVDDETLTIASVRDLTEQKRLRDALEASHERQAVLEERRRVADEMKVWADAFQHAAIGIAIADPNTGIIRHVNAAYAAMRGLTIEEAEGMPIASAYAPEERPRLPALAAELDRTGHASFESRHLRKDGSTFPVLIDVATMFGTDGALLYRVVSSRDLTESKRTEEALRQAAKMEAVGTLTGGMAHDFNNVLGVIVLSLDVAQRFLPDSDRTKKLVINALASARSAAALIRSLLAFARQQPLKPTRVTLNEQVAAAHHLLSRTLGEDIEIVIDPAPDLWPVIADPSQIEACLLNLAANARDAMPKGGRLTITTGNQRLDDDYVKLNPSVTPGDYAMIAIADTGTGMPPEVVAKIFEPFFTTKEQGKGTGLGLSMVFGFVAQSGGHVRVYSEPGLGTTFRLFLPRAPDAAGPEEGPVRTTVMTQQGHGEVILVVEDNAVLRAAVAEQLAFLGYHPREAGSATDALAMLETGQIALVLSDVVMPGGMDGFELAKQVGTRWPSVRVLLTSGFLSNRISLQSAPAPRILAKPYDLSQLAGAVRETLDTAAVDPDQ